MGDGELTPRAARPAAQVCQKVEEKQKTTYNEVADELVAEFMEQQRAEAESGRKMYEEKNIRCVLRPSCCSCMLRTFIPYAWLLPPTAGVCMTPSTC